MRHSETAQIFIHFGVGAGSAARYVDVGVVFISIREVSCRRYDEREERALRLRDVMLEISQRIRVVETIALVKALGALCLVVKNFWHSDCRVEASV